MTTATPAHTHHEVTLHERVERLVGADVRLFYGIAAPMAAVVGLIIALVYGASAWLAGAAFVLLVAAVAVVLLGFMNMMNEDEDLQQ